MNKGSATPSAVQYLVAPGTTVETADTGAALALGPLAARSLLLVLHVEDIIEQESLHVSIWGSVDGKDWGTQALFWYPQKFYRGVTPAALDLRQKPEIHYLQARWELNRWGRGYPRPHFQFTVEIQELEFH